MRALEERAIAPEDEHFWETFWTLPQSVEDIFNNVKPDDVRRLKQNAPRNLAILFNKVLFRLSTRAFINQPVALHLSSPTQPLWLWCVCAALVATGGK